MSVPTMNSYIFPHSNGQENGSASTSSFGSFGQRAIILRIFVFFEKLLWYLLSVRGFS